MNGICFLDTPLALQAHGDHFGPFEGHLVGCEYDTRRLIRMSLQRVDGWIQGAAYPLSLYIAERGARSWGRWRAPWLRMAICTWVVFATVVGAEPTTRGRWSG